MNHESCALALLCQKRRALGGFTILPAEVSFATESTHVPASVTSNLFEIQSSRFPLQDWPIRRMSSFQGNIAHSSWHSSLWHSFSRIWCCGGISARPVLCKPP